jgi:hypothetical protein
MTLHGDYVSIAATTAGVSGSITTVPIGAKLVGLNVSMKTADGGIISSIEIISTGFPQPLKLMPKQIFGTIATNMYAISAASSPLIDLTPYNLTTQSNTVTIKVTTTANETVIVGLMWVK